jgi:hypothetical protein
MLCAFFSGGGTMSPTLWALSVVEFGFLLAMLSVMLKRGLRQQFPVFFNYIATLVAMLVIGVGGTFWQCPGYFYLYWTLAAVSMFFGFAVFYEVFAQAFKPFSAVIDLGKLIFWWAGAFLLLASTQTAFLTAGSQANKIVAGVNLLEHSVQLMQCGLLLLLVIFEKHFSLPWRSHGMCIAVGLGAYAALDMMVSYTVGRFPAAAGQLDIFNGFASVSQSALWLYAVMLTQPERKSAQDSPKRLILQRWNEALTSYGYTNAAATSATGTVDSFLPGIEKTVDRVLARKAVH